MKKIRLFLLSTLLLSCISGYAAEFEFEDIQGHVHKLSDYKGKWVLVNFWATWCPSCLNELDDLVKFYNKRRHQDLMVIGIAMKSPRHTVESFIKGYEINYPTIIGNDHTASQIARIKTYPSNFLYSPSGDLAAYQLGSITSAEIEEYIARNTK